MKIKVKNLGVIKQAEFELGDLTIVCGANNSGKTYITYALFGFLETWQNLVSIDISRESIEQLLSKGTAIINLNVYTNNISSIIMNACKEYTNKLNRIFASPEKQFGNSIFELSLQENFKIANNFDSKMVLNKVGTASFSGNKNSKEVIVSFIRSEQFSELSEQEIWIVNRLFAEHLEERIKNMIFTSIFPPVFLASSERTGMVVFCKELSFSRNHLLEQMSQEFEKNNDNQSGNVLGIFRSRYKSYPLPIATNLEFTTNLERIFNKKSFIMDEHPDILADFIDIIGGEYAVTTEDELYYIPKQGKKVRLSMDGSSSAVRSLLDIGFYLKHEARKGDLLMIDEPELNLHPENQRRVARLIARLINIGIKVYITTHSDYIVKELNTLIMLNHDRPHLKRIAEEEGYLPTELISADRIKVYIAEEAPVKLDGKSRKVKCPTLVPAKIDPELGIEARTFDRTINDMNRIQDAILWGGD
jgi:hypothetical protein